MKRIIFLHIPKTAGQTVHSELARVFGPEHTSPVRVHTQASTEGQFPQGYKLYSGHLDWETLDTSDDDSFIFTVLRDPKDRIASFYFYLLHQSHYMRNKELSAHENIGLKEIKNRTAPEYFFGEGEEWKAFILDHYDNFYCRYFASRKVRGSENLRTLDTSQVIQKATNSCRDIDRIYTTKTLSHLENDIFNFTGKAVSIAKTHVNVGPSHNTKNKWAELLKLMGGEENRARLTEFTALDEALIYNLKQQKILY